MGVKACRSEVPYPIGSLFVLQKQDWLSIWACLFFLNSKWAIFSFPKFKSNWYIF